MGSKAADRMRPIQCLGDPLASAKLTPAFRSRRLRLRSPLQFPGAPPIDIVSCAILSMTPHPRLSGRVDALVRVHFKEIVGGLPAEHSIELRLRVSIEPGDHADRVKELVLAKTAKILRSVKGALESTSGEEVR